MATMIRYQPWSLQRDLLNEVNRFFVQSHAEAQSSDATGASGANAEWTPAVDIDEHSDKFVLVADVPGVDAKSIEITLEKGVLTLSGNRDRAVEPKGAEQRRAERASGRFQRRFSLPDTVDSDAVSARGSNGVLEIVIPKRAAVQPRRIAVN